MDDEISLLTTEQQAALQAIYDHFREHAAWPTFITIDRPPLRRERGLDTGAIIPSLPDSLIVQPRAGNVRPSAEDELRPLLPAIQTTAYACQVSLPHGQQQRVTNAVMDFLVGDGETPLRQAITALPHAAVMNPQVPAQLRPVIDQAARKIRPRGPGRAVHRRGGQRGGIRIARHHRRERGDRDATAAAGGGKVPDRAEATAR